MQKAVIYLRVSSQEQKRSGLGMRAQWRACRTFCEQRGLEIVRVVRDNGISAGVPLRKRKGGSVLLDLDGGVAVVALNVDRLFRSILDYLVTEEEWREANVECWFVDGLKLDTSEPELWFAQAVRVLASELERRLAAKRTKRALAVAKSKGIVPGPKVNDNDDVVNVALWLQASGCSLSEIAKRLNDNGFRTPVYINKKKKRSFGGSEFTHVQVRRLLNRASQEIAQ